MKNKDKRKIERYTLADSFPLPETHIKRLYDARTEFDEEPTAIDTKARMIDVEYMVLPYDDNRVTRTMGFLRRYARACTPNGYKVTVKLPVSTRKAFKMVNDILSDTLMRRTVGAFYVPVACQHREQIASRILALRPDMDIIYYGEPSDSDVFYDLWTEGRML